MKRKLIYNFVCLFLLIYPALSAQKSPSEFIDARNPVIQDLLHLTSIVGLAPKFTSYPISLRQLRSWLNELELKLKPEDAISLVLINKIREKFLSTPVEKIDEITLNVHSSIAFEVYNRTGADAIGWEYGWAERKPLLDFPVIVAFGGFEGFSFQSSADFDIREDHGAIEGPGNFKNFTNLPEEATFIDYNFPHTASASIDLENFNFGILRSPLSFGTGRTGSLSLGSSPDFYDAIRAEFWNDWFMWTGLFISLDGSLTNTEISSSELNGKTFEQKKFLVYHRFDFRPFDFLHIGLIEGMMVGAQDFNIKYLLPIGLIHNFYPWNEVPGITSASSLFGLEINATLFPGFSIYGQYAHNQFQTAFETSTYVGADQTPNAMSGLAGINFVLPVEKSLLNFNFEWVATNPWMYIRENALISYFSRHRILTNIAGASSIIDRPIGYELGPDAQVFSLAISFKNFPGYSVGFLAEYRQKGENNFSTAYQNGPAAVKLVTPTGVAENTMVLGLNGEMLLSGKGGLFEEILPGIELSLGVDLKLLLIENYKHQSGVKSLDFQNIYSISARLF